MKITIWSDFVCPFCFIGQAHLDTALENFEKNHISGEKYSADYGNIVEDEELCCKIGTGYDVVCANIVADVIIGMSGIFARFMKPDAQLIVSGIIDERLDEVLAALNENGFAVVSQENEEGWNCILLKQAQ